MGGTSVPTLCGPIAKVWNESVGTEVPPTMPKPAQRTTAAVPLRRFSPRSRKTARLLRPFATRSCAGVRP
ncbi:DUF6053 domain-containing protein [Lysobacter enzymogenes]|uniref:DUF6053 domain-containing protein n=1 Tax=Lysobacter enzymogenes TaxID=69 RepID=UPI003CCDEF3F